MIGGLGFGEVVFVLVIILVLFGPNKIPELARAVGGALGEFKTAQKAAEFDLSGFDELNRQNAEKKKQEAAALNEKIIKMAEDAGISAEGKTTDELLVLIAAKMNEADSENSKTDETDNGISESELNETAPAEETAKAEA
ncbi:twin-arginine translocase TatA/TatE family subunit [Methanimicrococcus sp. OttesenSCG-928-J09]|nr:twin-arginine translocase TatA/TatE family subunit [Methanimicrococcus sp. OttesenSCG-928-J09]